MGRILSNKEDIGRIVDDSPRGLTPSPEEQTLRILRGECPHNMGWTNVGHGHNDEAYECNICREMKFW